MNTAAELQAALTRKLLDYGPREDGAIRVDLLSYGSGNMYLVTTSKTASRVLPAGLQPIIKRSLELEDGTAMLYPHEVTAIVESAS